MCVHLSLDSGFGLANVREGHRSCKESVEGTDFSLL